MLKVKKILAFQILSAWENCTVTLTVQMLIDKLKDWVKRGLVDSQVWQDIQDLVNFDVPAATPVTIKVPEQVTPDNAVLSTASKDLIAY